jgi:hypothetical protein
MQNASQIEEEKRPGCGQLQFSLRDLLRLMLAAAVILGLGAACRDSEQFQGIYCLWSLLTVLLVGAIWIANRLCLVRPRLLAYRSLVIYLLALGVPTWSNTELLFGWQLAWITTMYTVTLNLFDQYTRGWLGVAIAFGGVSNLAFLIGYISLLAGIRWHSARRVVGWFAAVSVIAALATEPALALSTTNWTVFPTFGLWLASPWALLLGTLGMRAPVADGEATA